jgi:hypothetical protein
MSALSQHQPGHRVSAHAEKHSYLPSGARVTCHATTFQFSFCLAKQTSQQVTGVLPTAALRQRRTRKISEAEHVIKFSMGQDAGIRGDAAAMEFQPRAAVEINPQSVLN